METANLKKFAQSARRSLIEQVSNKLDLVLAQDSKAKREQPQAVKSLEELIEKQNKEQVIEKVAYIWFNRFCALRFMDVNHYTKTGIVSPAPDQIQPEILSDAKMGHIDELMVNSDTQAIVRDLLDGSTPARDPQSEAYRLLIVAACNHYHTSMPFLFERISDYTELLMLDDLLSSNSILANTREVMTEETCKDVEVIGWLYQFYISEKKDEVFAGLKKNKKITPDNIPAATQLFTPHWIVRYLVENSLGRLWMLNHPDSKLIDKMEYYIKPEQPEKDFLVINTPEELKICDPACGSGHMLTYAFDLLFSIYDEEGYQPSEIPTKILTHNLYGIEIDERAGELAAFALTMKARDKQKRFFNKKIQPNICVLENIDLTIKEEEQTLFTTNNTDQKWQQILNALSKNINREHLIHDLNLFQEADNFGSLLKPKLNQEDIKNTTIKAEQLLQENLSDVFLNPMLHQTIKAMKQADYLTQKYHVVIANPPYMGGKGMNADLKKWIAENYSDVKSDLFSAFIVRNTQMTLSKGQLGFMSPFVWMFISSYEKLRNLLINEKTITSLVQLEYSGFDGATVPICTFTLENKSNPEFRGGYVRLSDFKGSKNQAPKTLEAINNPDCGWFFRASSEDFKKIPGSPIAYWVSCNFRDCFADNPSTGSILALRAGMSTGDNTIFQRFWAEVNIFKIGFSVKDVRETESSREKWYPCHSGGKYRKWFGNHETIVNWHSNGREIRTFGLDKGHIRSAVRNESCYFKEGITWSKISSGRFASRFRPSGFLFDDTGRSGFSDKSSSLGFALGLFCSSAADKFLETLCPTLSFTSSEIAKIPFPERMSDKGLSIVDMLISLGRADWNSFETSWDFITLPLLQSDYRLISLFETYTKLRFHWLKNTLEMQRLEKENNRIFIDAYGLQDELTPEVPLSEITLTCNPHYRYKGKKTEVELEALLLADTMKEFISYAVGCMFGRYSLDKPGLILANQGETIEDYIAQIPSSTFSADEDNVIPILDGDWFSDDVTERFFKFLRVTFGKEHYEENLQFIEDAIGKSIRMYFLKDFYNDHVRRYKKRPIYWLFSSPKGSFNVLIYMHRYRPDTVSVILNGYLREFRAKLNAKLTHLEKVGIGSDSSKSEKAKAIKELEKLKKIITEVEDYERDVLYPLATEQVEIDLDDGVKVSYNKFGTALKKIIGLSK